MVNPNLPDSSTGRGYRFGLVKKKDVQELDVRMNNTYGGLRHYAAFRSPTETSGLPVLSETIFTNARGWVTDAWIS